jgi:hypothetical protein
MKDRFYEELEHVFDKFPKYHMNILLGDFYAKVGREDIFKPTIGNESLHESNKDNGLRVVNFTTSKNIFVKSTMFPHRNIHKYTWTSPGGKTHNQIYHILIDKRRHSSILDVQSSRATDCDNDHYVMMAKIRQRPAVVNKKCTELCGFRHNRSTTDPIFFICQILEKKWVYKETVHQLFIDLKKAYDSVRREVLYNIL